MQIVMKLMVENKKPPEINDVKDPKVLFLSLSVRVCVCVVLFHC